MATVMYDFGMELAVKINRLDDQLYAPLYRQLGGQSDQLRDQLSAYLYRPLNSRLFRQFSDQLDRRLNSHFSV